MVIEYMKEGIYRGPNEKDIASLSQIRKEYALRGEIIAPEFITPLPFDRGFKDYYSPKFIKRAEDFKEIFEIPNNHVEIRLPDGVNALNLIPDLHVGAGFTHYKRIEQETDVILGTPNSYIVYLGDLTEGFHWNPAQSRMIEQTPEQLKYVRSLFKYVADAGRLLAVVGGDHDTWSEKMGAGLYDGFAETYGAHYLRGMSYLTLYMGEQEYNITLAHKLPGNSIYNNTHPQMRAANRHGGAYGSHMIASAHNHKKGYSTDTVKGFGNQRIDAHYAALGPYKSQDDYSMKHGWAEQQAKEMYGASFILLPDRNEVIYQKSIVRAGEEMDRWQKD